jgi:hypothetical protein
VIVELLDFVGVVLFAVSGREGSTFIRASRRVAANHRSCA